MTSEREALAALLHDRRIGCLEKIAGDHPSDFDDHRTHVSDADRLVAAGVRLGSGSESLDAAWAKAEAALPEGWVGPFVGPYIDGTFRANAFVNDEYGLINDEARCSGSTPTSALLALADRLTGATEP